MTVPPLTLRRALVAHRPGRGRLYAPDVQAAVVAFGHQRRREGATWKQVATELGLRFETIRRWCAGASDAPALRRVEVVDEIKATGSGRCIVCPSGHRLEGLSLGDAIAVLRALG